MGVRKRTGIVNEFCTVSWDDLQGFRGTQQSLRAATIAVQTLGSSQTTHGCGQRVPLEFANDTRISTHRDWQCPDRRSGFVESRLAVGRDRQGAIPGRTGGSRSRPGIDLPVLSMPDGNWDTPGGWMAAADPLVMAATWVTRQLDLALN